jgi:8-oxo-dGTP pyrophosphatase MutT (NUDIX family)
MPKKKTPFGVFLALTFEDAIYKEYIGLPEPITNLVVQNLIITLREDGFFGFIGGSADPGESELQCLARECKEEGNIDISELDLTYVSSHSLQDGFRVVLYHAVITKHHAIRIIKASAQAEHFFNETAGLVSVSCHEKSQFYKNNFLALVKPQIGEIGKLLNDPTMIQWGSL